MHTGKVLTVVGTALLLAACGPTDERQWMKINEKYTTEQFRRDYAECSAKKDLDEACMRDRGWVEVTRSKTERDTDPRAKTPPPSGRTGFTGISTPK